jgi:hypothetical protein
MLWYFFLLSGYLTVCFVFQSPAGEGASATLTEQAGNRTSTRVILQRSATAAVDDGTHVCVC